MTTESCVFGGVSQNSSRSDDVGSDAFIPTECIYRDFKLRSLKYCN